MEDYERSVREFIGASIAEITKIQNMLDLVVPSLHEQVEVRCGSMHNSGIIHSNCTNSQHHDVRWDADLKVSLWKPEFHRGRLVANVASFFDFGHTGARVTINFASGLHEIFVYARPKFYSEEAAKTFFGDLVHGIATMRENLNRQIFEVILEHDEDMARWFGTANAFAEKAQDLGGKVAETRSVICEAVNELQAIAAALFQTKSFAKSKTIAGIRERIEKLTEKLRNRL